MTAATVDDVETALQILRRGVPGYQPEIDQDTRDLWHVPLSTYTGPVLVAAATSWITTEARFPALAEFLREARRAASSLALTERANGDRATQTCPECGDGRGQVLVDAAGQTTIRPCSRCNTAGWRRWSGGHYMAGHDCPECRDLRAGRSSTPAAPAKPSYDPNLTHEGRRR